MEFDPRWSLTIGLQFKWCLHRKKDGKESLSLLSMPLSPHARWGYLLARECADTFSHLGQDHCWASGASALMPFMYSWCWHLGLGPMRKDPGLVTVNRPQVTALGVRPPCAGGGDVELETMFPACGFPQVGSHCHRWPSMVWHRSKGHVSFLSERDSQGAHLLPSVAILEEQGKRMWRVIDFSSLIASCSKSVLVLQHTFLPPAHPCNFPFICAIPFF